MAGLKENKPYEHYEDAYAVWYKKRPTHWKCEKFKYYFSEKSKQNAPHLKAGAISFGEVIYKDENNLSIDTKSSYQEVLAGEFVINPLNLNFDLKSLRTALSKINVVVSTGYIILRTNGLLNPHYARWLLHQFDVAHMKTLGSGVRQTINYNDIGNSFFCKPSLEEQKKIAAFLDYETIKIERLIRKQLNLIELLKEKRQAVINHAVTKGLNPDAPLKNSGVEWSKTIPLHWGKCRLRWLSEIYSGGTPSKEITSYWENGVIPWINSGAVNHQYITEPTTYISKAAYKNSSAKWIPKDSLVIALAGQGKTKGTVALLGIDTTCNQSMAAIKLKNKELSKYLFWWLKGNYENIRNISGGDLREGLNLDLLGSIQCPIPGKEEKSLISLFLDKETTKIDTLIQKQLQQIELLKERRTALIAAAVTGKIDLRDWTPPASSTESSFTTEEATA